MFSIVVHMQCFADAASSSESSSSLAEAGEESGVLEAPWRPKHGALGNGILLNPIVHKQGRGPVDQRMQEYLLKIVGGPDGSGAFEGRHVSLLPIPKRSLTGKVVQAVKKGKGKGRQSGEMKEGGLDGGAHNINRMGETLGGRPPTHPQYHDDIDLMPPAAGAWEEAVDAAGGSLTLQIDADCTLVDESEIETPRMHSDPTDRHNRLPAIPANRIPRQSWPLVVGKGSSGRRRRRPAEELSLEEFS